MAIHSCDGRKLIASAERIKCAHPAIPLQGTDSLGRTGDMPRCCNRRAPDNLLAASAGRPFVHASGRTEGPPPTIIDERSNARNDPLRTPFGFSHATMSHVSIGHPDVRLSHVRHIDAGTPEPMSLTDEAMQVRNSSIFPLSVLRRQSIMSIASLAMLLFFPLYDSLAQVQTWPITSSSPRKQVSSRRTVSRTTTKSTVTASRSCSFTVDSARIDMFAPILPTLASRAHSHWR
jgi:hypothetical protein